jgi:predicted MPP superfamily phosphohydrolase
MSMRRVVLIVIFICTLLGVVAGGHVYLIQRLVIEPALPSPWATLVAAFVLSAGLALVLTPVAERTAPLAVARAIAWPASIWMGFAFLTLILLALSDVTWLLLGATFADPEASLVDVARMRAIGVGMLAFVAGGIGIRSAMRGPQLERITVPLPRWPAGLDGFRIVQISDVHIGPILDRAFAGSIVERCNALSPDLVVITGDLVDGAVDRVGDEIEPFGRLQARHGVFFITGNHDHYSGADAWSRRIAQLGIRVLRNQRVTIETGGAAFDLAGVEDHHAHLVSGRHREDVPATLAGRDPTLPVILLAHDPATFPAAARHEVDLQLSGHTHGGQIWPFKYFVRLATPYVCGLHRRGRSLLYVSRGTGFWGPPMRFLTPAEITEITVVRGPGASPITG